MTKVVRSEEITMRLLFGPTVSSSALDSYTNVGEIIDHIK